LNATGRAQAEAVARWLAAHGPRLEILYSSPNARAWQTAQAVVAGYAAVERALPLVADDRLQEVDLGDWQGLTREEVEAWDGDYYAQHRADWHNVPTRGGESRVQLKARACAVFAEITAQHAGQAVGIVSHGGTLGMLIEGLFGPIERPTLSNTSLTIFEQDGPDSAPNGGWQLKQVGWLPHLTGLSIGETW
jgi:broad specificity phosphatase PhoE